MSAKSKVRRYWDSTCFISILNSEETAEVCKGLLDAARAGKTEIFVSPIGQLEVIRPKGSPAPLPKEQRDTIQQWFENDYIRWHGIDRDAGAMAQQYCWDFNLHPRDAIHLAVAVQIGCDLLETLDKDLLKWDGKLPGVRLRIRRPGQPIPGSVFDTDAES